MFRIDLNEAAEIHQTFEEHCDEQFQSETKDAVKSLNIMEIIEETVTDEPANLVDLDETSHQFMDENSQQFIVDTPIIDESLESYKSEEAQLSEDKVPDCIEFDPERKKRSKDKTYNSDVTPRKCFLCPAEFEGTPEEHFQEFHNYVELDQCSQ